MSGKGRGSGKTPERLVNLLKDAVSKSNQSKVASETGLTRLTLQNYLKGIGEPTTATLEKLGGYFGVSVAWLRGMEDIIDVWREHPYVRDIQERENLEKQKRLKQKYAELLRLWDNVEKEDRGEIIYYFMMDF